MLMQVVNYPVIVFLPSHTGQYTLTQGEDGTEFGIFLSHMILTVYGGRTAVIYCGVYMYIAIEDGCCTIV